MGNNSIIQIKDLGFQWETNNPFLFCVHHKDAYPKGNEHMGPAASLKGRNLGNDFLVKDGWRMYHGREVPGFPQHPHRGFETVTIVLEGMVDHSDSMGAAGRYGFGDVQWMTAGGGMQHAEMFPLLHADRDNPLELFQIWLNLPRASKFVDPHYKMLWREEIPEVQMKDEGGRVTELTVIAGSTGNARAVPPAPDSWASPGENEVAIWLIRMEPGAHWSIPGASEKATRSLYYYQGPEIMVSGQKIGAYKSVAVYAEQDLELVNGAEESRLLMLQGHPIDEPVVQYGPFVMNSEQEIQQTITDYRRSEFGGWPWDRPDHVHDRELGRFARYADGTREVKG